MPGRKQKRVLQHVWYEFSTVHRARRCSLPCTTALGPGGQLLDNPVLVVHWSTGESSYMLTFCEEHCAALHEQTGRFLASLPEQLAIITELAKDLEPIQA